MQSKGQRLDHSVFVIDIVMRYQSVMVRDEPLQGGAERGQRGGGGEAREQRVRRR